MRRVPLCTRVTASISTYSRLHRDLRLLMVMRFSGRTAPPMGPVMWLMNSLQEPKHSLLPEVS